MLSKRIKELRVQSNLTQEQVSQIVNVSRPSYSSYENGIKPPLEVLIKLSNYYNVSLDYLAGISDVKAITYYDPIVAEFINQCLEIYYKQKKLIIEEYEKSIHKKEEQE